MIRRLVALLVIVVVMWTPVLAGRKVLVLPLDGNAPPETRKKLSASFQKIARVLEGDVQAGNATMNDTAAAIGCNPAQVKCVENVRATLGVDELVYGTADEVDGQITIVARRYQKGKKPRELSVTVASDAPATTVEADLLPVMSNDPLPNQGSGSAPDPGEGSGSAVDPNAGSGSGSGTEPIDTGPTGSNRERNIWIGITAGGGLVFALGLALWAQKRSLQDDIDNHPTNTSADFDRLKELEDKASTRGWAGTFFVIAGLGVAGYGGYRLWKYYKSKDVVVAPAPVEGGAAVIIRGGW